MNQQHILQQINEQAKSAINQIEQFKDAIDVFYNNYLTFTNQSNEKTENIKQRIQLIGNDIQAMKISINLKFDQVDKAFKQKKQLEDSFSSSLTKYQQQFEDRVNNLVEISVNEVKKQIKLSQKLTDDINTKRQLKLIDLINSSNNNLTSMQNKFKKQLDLLNRDLHGKSDILSQRIQNLAQNEKKVNEKFMQTLKQYQKRLIRIKGGFDQINRLVTQNINQTANKLTKITLNQGGIEKRIDRIQQIQKYSQQNKKIKDQLFTSLQQSILENSKNIGIVSQRYVTTYKELQQLQKRLTQFQTKSQSKLTNIRGFIDQQLGKVWYRMKELSKQFQIKIGQLQGQYEQKLNLVKDKFDYQIKQNKKTFNQLDQLIAKNRQLQRWNKEDTDRQIQKLKEQNQRIQEQGLNMSINMASMFSIENSKNITKIQQIQTQIKNIIMKQKQLIDFRQVSQQQCNNQLRKTLETSRIISKINQNLQKQSASMRNIERKIDYIQNDMQLKQSENRQIQQSLIYKLQQLKQKNEINLQEINGLKNDLYMFQSQQKQLSKRIANHVNLFTQQINGNRVNIRYLSEQTNNLRNQQTNLFKTSMRIQKDIQSMVKDIFNLNTDLKQVLNRGIKKSKIIDSNLQDLRNKYDTLASRGREQIKNIYGILQKQSEINLNRFNEGYRKVQNIDDKINEFNKQNKKYLNDLRNQVKKQALQSKKIGKQLDSFTIKSKQYNSLKQKQIKMIEDRLKSKDKVDQQQNQIIKQRIQNLNKGINIIGRQLVKNTFDDLMIRSPTFRYKVLTGSQTI